MESIAPHRRRTAESLSRLEARLRGTPLRGRGHLALQALRSRLASGEDVELDEKTANLLDNLFESFGFAVDDLRGEANRNKQITGRTINAALRGGFR